MLVIKPVADVAIAEALCCEIGETYIKDSFTYFAADTDEIGEKINYIIGVCSFTMRSAHNEIVLLKSAPNVDDEEALIIMARAVMNFMYRCEVKTVTADENGVSERLLDKLGFTKENGKFTLNLEEYYKAPCKFHK